MKKTLFIILSFLFANLLQAQNRSFYASNKNLFWNQTSLTGEFRTGGHYRTHKIDYNFISDNQKSSYWYAGGLLNSKSFIWHPNFLTIELEAEYNPDFIKEKYIIIPDLSETRTTKRFSARTSLFNNKKINFGTSTNLSQIYSNREFITNIKTDTKAFGAIFSYSNKVLPFSINYSNTKWTQQETETLRSTFFDRQIFDFRGSKSFYANDKHELSYSHNEYKYSSYNFMRVNTFADIFTLSNHFNFDKKQNYSLSSQIIYHDQRGTILFNRFSVYENLLLKLPKRFQFQALYNCNKYKQEFLNTNSQNVKALLSKKVFLSLYANIFFEYKTIDQTQILEKQNSYGTSIQYTKKIPLKGRFNFSFSQIRSNNDISSQNAFFQIRDEEHYLNDANMELLSRPNVIIGSVTVKSADNSIIYQENIDYILIQRNTYIEIQRFPGGQIPDNSSVLIDYTAERIGDYSYNTNITQFNSSVAIFENLFEVYFNCRNQNFTDEINTEFTSLNYYQENIYGAKFDIKFLNAGIEFDNYKSNLIPYKSERYYLGFQNTFFKKLLVSAQANYKNFNLIDENVNQKFYDASLKGLYRIKSLSSLSAVFSYRKQQGTGIDLELLTARLEFKTTLRQLDISLGAETYYRNFLGNKNIYEGVFFKLIRRF